MINFLAEHPGFHGKYIRDFTDVFFGGKSNGTHKKIPRQNRGIFMYVWEILSLYVVTSQHERLNFFDFSELLLVVSDVLLKSA